VIAVPAIQAYLTSQSLVAVGVSTAARTPIIPGLPTIAEQGFPNYVVDGWFGVIGPAKMASADVNRIHDAFVVAVAAPGRCAKPCSSRAISLLRPRPKPPPRSSEVKRTSTKRSSEALA
jgi:hypothetical protein